MPALSSSSDHSGLNRNDTTDPQILELFVKTAFPIRWRSRQDSWGDQHVDEVEQALDASTTSAGWRSACCRCSAISRGQ
jgi:hypothetical protein